MKVIKILDKIVKLIWIFIVVGLIWQLIEIAMLGHINPNHVDTVISIILTFSLYKNFENQKWFKGEEIG